MAKNARAIAKMRKDAQATAELHEKVRRGELTAGEALVIRAGNKRGPTGRNP